MAKQGYNYGNWAADHAYYSQTHPKNVPASVPNYYQPSHSGGEPLRADLVPLSSEPQSPELDVPDPEGGGVGMNVWTKQDRINCWIVIVLVAILLGIGIAVFCFLALRSIRDKRR